MEPRRIALLLCALVLAFGGGGGDAPAPGPNVTEGSRHVVILHESDSSQASVPFGIMVNNLRTGQNAAYLNLKKHRLDILDDAEDENEQVPPLVQQLQKLNVPEPSLFILDGDDDPVIYSGTLPPGANANYVMEALKKTGG